MIISTASVNNLVFTLHVSILETRPCGVILKSNATSQTVFTVCVCVCACVCVCSCVCACACASYHLTFSVRSSLLVWLVREFCHEPIEISIYDAYRENIHV